MKRLRQKTVSLDELDLIAPKSCEYAVFFHTALNRTRIQKRSWVRWRRVGRYAIRNLSTLKSAHNLQFRHFIWRDYLSTWKKTSETFGLPKSELDRTNKFNKKKKQNSWASWTSPLTHGMFRAKSETRERIEGNTSCRFIPRR